MNTVFIADDNDTDRTILEATLQKFGFNVVSFSNGAAMLTAIRKHEMPLVIIVDWVMPDLSGIDICRELKANPPGNPIHTIIVTARSEKSDVALALDSGADDFISKPYNVGELRARTNSGYRLLSAMVEREKMLENAQRIASIESLGLVAGGIAHNFNNLMSGIFGFIDIASEASKDAKVLKYLSKANDTIDRAKALTAQLLTFAKGGDPVLQVTQLIPFVQETAQITLSRLNVPCTFYMAGNLRPCSIDKTQITQVFDNIIINAQEAMPDGGSIDLSAINVSSEENGHPTLVKGNYVRISIKDYGIGIPGENLSRIFVPFFSTKPNGQGLGLATCYSIIHRHGGCIEVATEPGYGSTFHIFLPAS